MITIKINYISCTWGLVALDITSTAIIDSYLS